MFPHPHRNTCSAIQVPDERRQGRFISNKRSNSSGNEGDTAWAWSCFWQDDNFAACSPESDISDSLLLREWQSFFTSLQSGSRILDLGTGNGALAAMAADASRREDRSFEIHGSDLAAIEPRTYVRSRQKELASILFHAETPMEALPFGDERFDAVCGQYALEYSDTDRSVAELMRVLCRGGRLRFLLHSAGGVLHERNRGRSRQAKILLDSDLLAVTRVMLSAVVAGEAGNNSAALHTGRQAIESLKVVMDRLADRFSKDADRALPENVFAAIRRLAPLRHQHDIAQLLVLVDDIERRLQAQDARLQAMLDATLDDAKLQQLGALFVANDARDVRTGKALEGTHETPVGYWLDARKV